MIGIFDYGIIIYKCLNELGMLVYVYYISILELIVRGIEF